MRSLKLGVNISLDTKTRYGLVLCWVRSVGVCRIGWYLQLNRTCEKVSVQSFNSFSFISKPWINHLTIARCVAFASWSYQRTMNNCDAIVVASEEFVWITSWKGKSFVFWAKQRPFEKPWVIFLIISCRKGVKSDGHSLFQQDLIPNLSPYYYSAPVRRKQLKDDRHERLHWRK